MIELGRYLVGESGVYVTRVVDRKVSRGRVYLVVDGGLHHQLAASGNFGQVIRRNYPIAIANRCSDAERRRVGRRLSCARRSISWATMSCFRARDIGDLVVQSSRLAPTA